MMVACTERHFDVLNDWLSPVCTQSDNKWADCSHVARVQELFLLIFCNLSKQIHGELSRVVNNRQFVLFLGNNVLVGPIVYCKEKL